MNQLQPKRIDRSNLLANSLFWAVHSHEQTRADDWIEAFFGLSAVDYEAFWQQELPSVVPGEPDFFPCYCLTLPLRCGCSVSVEYEAYPEDFGIAYYVRHPSWESPVLLSRYPSAYDCPPFRWEEAVLIAGAVPDGTESICRRAALPLLFPGVWLTAEDDLNQVRLRLHSAWAELRIVKPKHLNDMVATMVKAQGVQQLWRHDPQLGWVNDGWSFRNPQHSAPVLFSRVKEFFAALSGTRSV